MAETRTKLSMAEPENNRFTHVPHKGKPTCSCATSQMSGELPACKNLVAERSSSSNIKSCNPNRNLGMQAGSIPGCTLGR